MTKRATLPAILTLVALLLAACALCAMPAKAYAEIASGTSGTYEKTWRQYKVTPYPFYEYWIKQAKWDSRARRAIYGVA